MIPWSRIDFGEDEKKAIQRVLDSGWFTCGRETEAFERELAPVTGYKYNICVSNGTGALVAALHSFKAHRRGVIKHIPAYAYQATLNAVYAVDSTGNVQYHDVDIDTGLVEPVSDGVQIPIHYAGLPLNPEKWKDENKVIFDAAEALGASTRHDNLLHSGPDLNRVACYSFHAAKIVTSVEGGCCSTDNPLLAYQLKAARNQGESPDRKGVFVGRGLNLKPMDINSAIGRVQLSKLDKYLHHRQRIADLYREGLEEYAVFQMVPSYVRQHGNMMVPMMVDKPMTLAEYLGKHGVATRLGWAPLKQMDGAKILSDKTIYLPIGNAMTMEEVDYVIGRVKECLKKY